MVTASSVLFMQEMWQKQTLTRQMLIDMDFVMVTDKGNNAWLR